jgi:repressor LexA
MIVAMSPRQRDTHAFMLAFHRTHGVWPSLREIAKALGIKSTNAVHDHLVALKSKGWARQRPNCARGWIAIEAEARECEVRP